MIPFSSLSTRTKCFTKLQGSKRRDFLEESPFMSLFDFLPITWLTQFSLALKLVYYKHSSVESLHRNFKKEKKTSLNWIIDNYFSGERFSL